MLSILLTFTSIIIPSFSCPIHQKQALLHFKSTLTSIYNSKYPVNFAELDSWNSTSDCCYWERVTCSRTGSVTELHLYNVTFPPPSYDQVPLSSDILTPLFHIRSLELLDISYNYFEGEIPSLIVHFFELDSWNSTSNCCSWERVNCSTTGSVTELQLSDVATPPPPDFEQVPISSDILTPLFHIRSLELLDMSINYFEGEIPGDGFGNLTKLLHLDMWRNNFNGSIPNQLFQLTNLRYLDMGYNNLEGRLGPELGRLTNLTLLDLSSNQFTGPIPSSMQNFSKLEWLGLQDNLLSGEIPTWLLQKSGTLKGLIHRWKGKQVDMDNKHKVHPRCSLLSISMTSCGISGQIPEWISSQKELVALDLSGNELEGRFPHWLAEMNNITSIYLSDNNLNGQIPPRLFESEWWLQFLDLSRNNFSGELPENIGNTTSINYLVVSENDFSGLIPKSISNLTGLQLLDLSRNRFSGNLPVLGARYLDLSDNDFFRD
ncbi:leucine-rich repeat-containing protein [Tanacetum coccineum]